jgi:hypothetical protein
MATGIITWGIGPAGNVSHFLTLGLQSAEAPPAPTGSRPFLSVRLSRGPSVGLNHGPSIRLDRGPLVRLP